MRRASNPVERSIQLRRVALLRSLKGYDPDKPIGRKGRPAMFGCRCGMCRPSRRWGLITPAEQRSDLSLAEALNDVA